MSLTTQQGPFPVKRNDTFKNHWRDETRISAAASATQGGKALVNRLGIIQAQLGETQPVTSNRRVRISDAG